MLRACFLATALLLAALALMPVAPLVAQRVEHTIFVSALDKSGAPLPSIAPTDVVITEDKATREVIRVVPAIEPMEIAILVDNSQASESFIRDYRDGLPAFIKALSDDETGARHQVAVITIGERPTINTDYTLDLDRAIQGTQRIFSSSGSGAYLLDGIIETSHGISKRATAQRPVIVAITTEGPELSNQHYQTVLEPLRASGAAFHSISIGRPENNSEDRSIVLDVGARDTGGSHQILLASTGLKARLLQLAAVMTHQFKVTYARPQSLLQPNKISVTAARSGITVRGTPVPAARER
jgi:hypothetical protein